MRAHGYDGDGLYISFAVPCGAFILFIIHQALVSRQIYEERFEENGLSAPRIQNVHALHTYACWVFGRFGEPARQAGKQAGRPVRLGRQ